MATVKQIKKILKELGITETEMDYLWNELKDYNCIIKNLANAEMDWRDLNDYLIREIPGNKNFCIIQKKEEEEKERLEKERAEKKEIEKAYYKEHFLELMELKISKQEFLTEKEISGFVEYEVEKECGDNGRWNQEVTSYIQGKTGKWYAVDWQEGLTEYQESCFPHQPYEVERFVEKKVVEVTIWKKVN